MKAPTATGRKNFSVPKKGQVGSYFRKSAMYPQRKQLQDVRGTYTPHTANFSCPGANLSKGPAGLTMGLGENEIAKFSENFALRIEAA